MALLRCCPKLLHYDTESIIALHRWSYVDSAAFWALAMVDFAMDQIARLSGSAPAFRHLVYLAWLGRALAFGASAPGYDVAGTKRARGPARSGPWAIGLLYAVAT